MQEFRRMIHQAGVRPSTLLIYGLLVIIAAFFSMANMTVIIALLQVLFGQTTPPAANEPGWAGGIRDFLYDLLAGHLAQSKEQALYWICMVAVIAMIGANTFRYLSQLILARIRVKTMGNLRHSLFSKILALPHTYFVHARGGDITSRMTTDIQEMEQGTVSALKVFIKEPIMLAAYLGMLFFISTELAIYTLLLVPVSGWLVSVVGRQVRRWSLKSQATLGQIASLTDETISMLRIFNVYGANAWIKKRFSEAVSDHGKQSFQVAARSNLASPISEVMGTLVLVSLLIVGGSLVLSGDTGLSAAAFIGFLIIFSQALVPAKAISVAVGQLGRGLGAAGRYFEMLDLEEKAPTGDILPVKENDDLIIQMEQVTFGHEGHHTLSGVSLNIRANEKVLLVGGSGAGKTTLLNLLCGFLEPDNGKIRLAHCLLNRKQGGIGLVSQDALFLHDTIYNNLTLGAHFTEEEVWAALQGAYLDEFVRALPEGLGTIVGARGMRLSGGQQQRLAIARAILRQPSLLILDEATSALDAQSEAEVHRAINQASIGRAVVIVSHKPNEALTPDHTYQITQGRLIELPKTENPDIS